MNEYFDEQKQRIILSEALCPGSGRFGVYRVKANGSLKRITAPSLKPQPYAEAARALSQYAHAKGWNPVIRRDSAGRDVTDLPGLWDESDTLEGAAQ